MSSIVNIIRRRIRKAITTFYDPLIEINIGAKKLLLPLSHPLKENIVVCPDLNRNLPRIIKYSLEYYSDVKVIDIGANIGDTVAFIKDQADVPILCIDADEKYLGILRRNIKNYPDVSVCHALVGAENKVSNLIVKTERGTGTVVEGSTSTAMRTLENILEEFPTFKNSKFLKIDTDGFDTLIIRGSANYLAQNKPIVFFEFDPHFIRGNDNAYSFFDFVIGLGYEYFMFYMNNGEYLISCTKDNKKTIDELVHFFSGRNVTIFTDVFMFMKQDKTLFDKAVEEELAYFRKVRGY